MAYLAVNVSTTCGMPMNACMQAVPQPLPQVIVGAPSGPRPTAEAEAAGSRLGAWSQAPPAEAPTAQQEPSSAAPFEKVTISIRAQQEVLFCWLSFWITCCPQC